MMGVIYFLVILGIILAWGYFSMERKIPLDGDNYVDQSNTIAGGDIVGRDKNETK